MTLKGGREGDIFFWLISTRTFVPSDRRRPSWAR